MTTTIGYIKERCNDFVRKTGILVENPSEEMLKDLETEFMFNAILIAKNELIMGLAKEGQYYVVQQLLDNLNALTDYQRENRLLPKDKTYKYKIDEVIEG